jgi:tight adherence protein C
MDVLVPLIAAVLVFAAIVYLGVLAMRRRDAAARRRSLAMVEGYASHDVHGAMQAARRNESLLHEIGIGLGTALTTQKNRDRIERNVLYTGNYDPTAPQAILIRKVVYLVVGLVLGLLVGASMGGIWWLALPIMAVGGFYVPDLLIYNAGLKRDEEMAKKLPDALDMLNLCVEAGLSFQAGLAQVAQNQTGPVAEEFGLALKEMQVGRSRAQALVALAGRTRQDDIKRFVNAMLQVDKLGVPVAAVLREQANEMRAKRYARAREAAQKVPIKILMPLMLCFLPALFVIILGPAVNSIVQVFSGLNH